MTIKVFIDYIQEDEYNMIVDYYNMNIPYGQPKLEILDRCEGGFQIQDLSAKYETDENLQIKQLRWKNKRLVPHSTYKGFEKYEEIMLFIAMRSVVGNNVTLDDS
jgi:predicted nucleic acid-binding protein